MNWQIAQEHEKNWWGNCCNTFGEELKQTIYADKMGIKFIERDGNPFIIDLEGKTVLDVGCGPSSLLLKTVNGKRGGIDPCDYPEWVLERYKAAGINFAREAGEDMPEDAMPFISEIWIYNVLQHVKDPESIIKKAKLAKKIRIFEWIDAETNAMHPHQLTEEKLNEWLGGKGTVEQLNGIAGCFGKAYYGTF